MATAAKPWQPGDPVYAPPVPVSYTAPLADCCPPGCWCRAVISRGGCPVRWTPDEPILRFVAESAPGAADGLRVTEPRPRRRRYALSGPFSNSDSGELFIANRCDRCAFRNGIDDPCDDFLPAYVGVWPEILARVPISDANPVGVECTRFEVAR